MNSGSVKSKDSKKRHGVLFFLIFSFSDESCVSSSSDEDVEFSSSSSKTAQPIPRSRQKFVFLSPVSLSTLVIIFVSNSNPILLKASRMKVFSVFKESFPINDNDDDLVFCS